MAVRIDPTKSDVALDKLLEKAQRDFHFPPVRVFVNDVEQADRGLDQLDRPIIEAPIRYSISGPRPEGIRVLRSDPEGEVADLLATSNLEVTAIPLDLTAHSPTAAIRGQMLAIMGEANGTASLLPALPPALRKRLPKKLADQLSACIRDRSAAVGLTAGSSLRVSLRLECNWPAIKALDSWLRSQEEDHFGESYFPRGRYGRHALSDLLGDARLADSERDEGPITLLQSYQVPSSVIMGEVSAGLLTEDWLGHNGIRVSTQVENIRFSRERELALFSRDGRAFIGAVCLFDELRPDVSGLPGHAPGPIIQHPFGAATGRPAGCARPSGLRRKHLG